MGFMILAAVPVLAIKYKASHGNQNVVAAKSQGAQNAQNTEQARSKAEMPGSDAKDEKAATRASFSNSKSSQNHSRTPINGAARSRAMIQPVQHALTPLSRNMAQSQPQARTPSLTAGTVPKGAMNRQSQAVRFHSSKNR